MDKTVSNMAEATSGVNKFIDSLINFFTENNWNILIFAIVLTAGIVAINLLLKVIRAALKKHSADGIMQHFVINVSKCLMIIVLILILFKTVGVELSGVTTALAAILLAIGVALQNYIANIASGIIIACSKLYHKGDYLIVDGVEGQIDKINILFTTLHTYENKKVIVPNSKITSESVVNVFANNCRRVNFRFKVAYESDVEIVKNVVIGAITSDPRVKKEPAPFCGLYKMADSSLDFAATCFCDVSDYWKVYFYITEQVYNEFKRNGITVPFAQSEVRIRTDEVKMPVISEDAAIRGAQVAANEESEKGFARRGISE